MSRIFWWLVPRIRASSRVYRHNRLIFAIDKSISVLLPIRQPFSILQYTYVIFTAESRLNVGVDSVEIVHHPHPWLDILATKARVRRGVPLHRGLRLVSCLCVQYFPCLLQSVFIISMQFKTLLPTVDKLNIFVLRYILVLRHIPHSNLLSLIHKDGPTERRLYERQQLCTLLSPRIRIIAKPPH